MFFFSVSRQVLLPFVYWSFRLFPFWCSVCHVKCYFTLFVDPSASSPYGAQCVTSSVTSLCLLILPPLPLMGLSVSRPVLLPFVCWSFRLRFLLVMLSRSRVLTPWQKLDTIYGHCLVTLPCTINETVKKTNQRNTMCTLYTLYSMQREKK